MSHKIDDQTKAHDVKQAQLQQQQALNEAQNAKGGHNAAAHGSEKASASQNRHKVDEVGLDKLKQDEQWKNFSHTRAPVQAPSMAVQQHGVAPVEEVHKTSAAQMLRDVTQGVKA